MKLKAIKNFDLISFVDQRKIPLLIALMVLLLVVPFLGLSSYVIRVLCMVFVYSILTISLNFVTGYLGATSMGHAALYCVGAYVGALAATRLGSNVWESLILSLLVGLLVGGILGVCTMKLSGSYMTVTTLAFAQVVTMIAKNWTSVTNGTLGIKSIPKANVFGIDLTVRNGGMYFLGLGLLVLVIVLSTVIIKSKYGRAFIAVRDDELGARMMGLQTKNYRLLGTVISGGLAGVAGCYYSYLTGYIDPVTFSFDISMTILTMAILGGLASIPGSIVGAALLTVFPELLRELDVYRYLFFGFILVIMMRMRPQGILGNVKTSYYRMPKGVVRKQNSENALQEQVKGG